MPIKEILCRSLRLVDLAATGAAKLVARLPFTVQFRANWVDGGTALVVNRVDTTSHIVSFDRFWQP